MWYAFLALVSHWRKNPWQLAMLLAGLALSTALWSGVQAINAEARASYAQASNVVGAVEVARVLRRDGAAMSVEEFVTLRRLGWLVSPVMEGNLDVGGQRFRVVGIEPLTFPGPIPSLFSDQDTPDGSAARSSVAVVNPADAGALSSFPLTLREDEQRPQGSILMDIAEADTLLGSNATIRRLLLEPAQTIYAEPLPETYRIAQADVQADVARLTQSFHLNLTAFGLLSFCGGYLHCVRRHRPCVRAAARRVPHTQSLGRSLMAFNGVSGSGTRCLFSGGGRHRCRNRLFHRGPRFCRMSRQLCEVFTARTLRVNCSCEQNGGFPGWPWHWAEQLWRVWLHSGNWRICRFCPLITRAPCESGQLRLRTNWRRFPWCFLVLAFCFPFWQTVWSRVLLFWLAC